MALSLGLREGKDVMIGTTGDVRLVIKTIHDSNNIDIVVYNKLEERHYTLTDDCTIEVYPNVRVSLGNTGEEDLARLLFEAPRDIKLLRGDVFRKDLLSSPRIPHEVQVIRKCAQGWQQPITEMH